MKGQHSEMYTNMYVSRSPLGYGLLTLALFRDPCVGRVLSPPLEPGNVVHQDLNRWDRFRVRLEPGYRIVSRNAAEA